MKREEELHRTWQAMMAERKINVSFDTFLTIVDVADEHPKNPWRTPLKELPEIGEMVLAITAGGSQTVLRYDGLYFTRTFGMNITMKDGGNTEIKYEQNFRSVLAWMPIPKGGNV